MYLIVVVGKRSNAGTSFALVNNHLFLLVPLTAKRKRALDLHDRFQLRTLLETPLVVAPVVASRGGLVDRGEKLTEGWIALIFHPVPLIRIVVGEYEETMNKIAGGGVRACLVTCVARGFSACPPPITKTGSAIEMTTIRAIEKCEYQVPLIVRVNDNLYGWVGME